MAQQIDAVTLERSEKFVRVLFESGEWPTSALRHLNIEEVAMSRFIAHQVQTMRAMYPDIDPRHEAALATMLTHLFFCGVAAGRGTGYSADQGVTV